MRHLTGLIFPCWLGCFIASGVFLGSIGVVCYAVLTAYVLRKPGNAYF